ncbi:hypothetical protein ACWKWU_22630 [Chitinophaga lutea]
MARTFYKRAITIQPEGPLNRNNARLEVNTSEADGTLDLAVYVTDPGFVENENAKIRVFVNEHNGTSDFMVELDKVKKAVKGAKEAIYQGSLPLDKLTLKDNLVTLYENSQGGVGLAVDADGFVRFGTLTGFVEDTAAVDVKLQRAGFEETTDKVFWKAIINNTLKFEDYTRFIDSILCRGKDGFSDYRRQHAKTRSVFIATEEYNLLKFATEFFMLKNFGIPASEIQAYLGNSTTLPYYQFIVRNVFESPDDAKDGTDDCLVRETDRIDNPFFVELIWNYWMEQGMLVQTLNIINLRFQHIANIPEIKALDRFDLDPLRPLSHLLWGYIQDEQHRLSIKRRAYEYDHEYGLTLIGKAVPPTNVIDARVEFLESFHNLLSSCTIFFKESDDTTRIADAFPILNQLREVHLQLAEGNHNAYGNLTWTARHEMMMMQYILARPEMKEFLGGKPMIPYNEPWMDRVDNMRSIQGWGGASIIHYYELAVCGEQLLLSIRFGNWSDVNLGSANAGNWATTFRDRIQRYIHSYRVVTGVDLTDEAIDSTAKAQRSMQPSLLIQRRAQSEKGKIRRA